MSLCIFWHVTDTFSRKVDTFFRSSNAAYTKRTQCNAGRGPSLPWATRATATHSDTMSCLAPANVEHGEADSEYDISTSCTRRMHGIVGERERSNSVVDMSYKHVLRRYIHAHEMYCRMIYT